jgi:NAD(P)-dependent dehydrogenase (short-subunit alcohol dehydrogenase family)
LSIDYTVVYQKGTSFATQSHVHDIKVYRIGSRPSCGDRCTLFTDEWIHEMTDRFSGKVALVTGAASGIGRAAATAFAAEGARVVLADRDRDGAEAAAEQIRSTGASASATAVDISDAASCVAMVEFAMETYGGLHVAFNNAGIPTALPGGLEDLELAQWRQVIDVNLSGTYYCMRAEAPALRASKGTSIVNTASIAALTATPGMVGYVASKHGVAGLTKAAALDLIPHGIRVTAVCPGFVETAMLAPLTADAEGRSMIEGSAPIRRIARAEEIARAVLFLSSDEASYAVGSLLSIDGGLAVL